MKKVPERRDVLLGKIVDALLAEGIADLSLRPLAKTVGSSARLLIYHFGTKEQLLTDALAEVRLRIETSVRELAQEQHPQSLEAFLLMFWKWALQDSNRQYFRLLFEIDGLAMQNREKFSKEFWGAGFSKWIGVFETSFGVLAGGHSGQPGASTLVLAALNGLLHDLLASGDRKRTTAALHFLIEKMSSTVDPPKRVRKKKVRR
jgi:AcrR family transcriptional regulator